MKVSVIIPIYNCEKYLSRCLDSVCGQTLQDIEIICVNDGSADESRSIIYEYAGRDRRIAVIDKPNGGLVSARKAGVAAAHGDYVGYVDGDDWIEADMYEALYGLAVDNQADMVCSGYIVEGGYTSYENDSVDEGLYDENRRREILDHAIFNMPEKDLGLRGSLCCKLFRRELIQETQRQIPDDITYSEDKMCVLTFALKCRNIYVVHKAWYHYILNSSSMTQKPNTDYLLKINAVYGYLSKLYDHPDFSDNMRRQAELYITQLLIKGINSRMGFSVKNLMWIDSEWMFQIEEGAEILLFGKGALADTYARQIENSGKFRMAGCIDDAENVKDYSFDFIVITYKYGPKADEVRAALIQEGVSAENIFWFEQKEIFWKYAEDAGLT